MLQQNRKAISAGWFYVPYEAIGDENSLMLEKQKLTFVPKFDEEEKPVRLFRDLHEKQYLGVPRAYGMHRFAHLEVDDRRTLGEAIQAVPRLPDPNHPSVKEPERQAQFMRDLDTGIMNDENFLAVAGTGTGKTVCFLRSAAVYGRKTAILVHLDRLMSQWLDEIESKLGVDPSRIGVVQGSRCEWENKDFVVCMMKSLSMRRYPPEFYRSFGLVGFDETHRVGSPMLSATAPLFPARKRVGLSATPERKDGGDRVFFWHIGPIKVRSEAAALPMNVFVKRYKSRGKLWGNNRNARVSCIARDPYRNQMITDLIVRMWRANRQVLIIGDYVWHLQELMERAQGAGVPREAMGQYTSERQFFSIVQTPQGGTKRKKTRSVKTTPEEFERIKRESQLIFATYGIFSEGIDVPRLDAGIDVTPRSDATQVIGRVRRPHEGKPDPFWVTILDENCNFSTRFFQKRSRDYRDTGATIVDDGRI